MLIFISFIIGFVSISGASTIDSKHVTTQICHNNNDCKSKAELCVRGICQNVYKSSPNAPRTLPQDCLGKTWPEVQNCAVWSEIDDGKNSGTRTLESNSVPPYYVPPYCPFGIGQGYCQSPIDGDSTDCDVFRDMTCPCEEGSMGCKTSTEVGDVFTPTYQYFEFPLNPDPTKEDLPLHMYDNNCLKSGNSYQVIGAHLNGIQIKGPAEANGYNVDTSLIPLPCGGHVTPPVGPGPLYHYHKAADCVEIQEPGEHGPLIGFAADGFGIYGFGDYRGMPVLDECHGHFGVVPNSNHVGGVEYHYHVSDEYNTEGTHHKPYYMGCQGPSKGLCNTTINEDYDFGANWCGPGCGYDVCVQPETDPEAFYQYLDQFPAGREWLDGLSINNF